MYAQVLCTHTSVGNKTLCAEICILLIISKKLKKYITLDHKKKFLGILFPTYFGKKNTHMMSGKMQGFFH